jgi:hypothetical protein
MAELKILRRSKSHAINVGTNVIGSTSCRLEDAAIGIVIVRSASTAATSLEVWAGHAADETFVPLADSDGNSVAIALNTTGDHAYSLPLAAAGARHFKLVANAALGTAASVSVSIKS